VEDAQGCGSFLNWKIPCPISKNTRRVRLALVLLGSALLLSESGADGYPWILSLSMSLSRPPHFGYIVALSGASYDLRTFRGDIFVRVPYFLLYLCIQSSWNNTDLTLFSPRSKGIVFILPCHLHEPLCLLEVFLYCSRHAC